MRKIKAIVILAILLMSTTIINFFIVGPYGGDTETRFKKSTSLQIAEKYILINNETIAISFYNDRGIIVEIIRLVDNNSEEVSSTTSNYLNQLASHDNRFLLDIESTEINIEDLNLADLNRSTKMISEYDNDSQWEKGGSFNIKKSSSHILGAVITSGEFIFKNNIFRYGLGVKQSNNDFLSIIYQGSSNSTNDKIRFGEFYKFTITTTRLTDPFGEDSNRMGRSVSWESMEYPLLDEKGNILRVAKAYTRADGGITAKNLTMFPFTVTYGASVEFYIDNVMYPISIKEKTSLWKEKYR